MKNLKTFESFQETENVEIESNVNIDHNDAESIDEGVIRKFFTGHEEKSDELAAQKKFLDTLADAEKALKADAKNFAQAEKWEEAKAFLMGQAYTNKYRGGLRVQRGGGRDKRVFIVYDPKATGFQDLASAAGGAVGVFRPTTTGA